MPKAHPLGRCGHAQRPNPSAAGQTFSPLSTHTKSIALLESLSLWREDLSAAIPMLAWDQA
jgi:hypothetical protein